VELIRREEELYQLLAKKDEELKEASLPSTFHHHGNINFLLFLNIHLDLTRSKHAAESKVKENRKKSYFFCCFFFS